MRNTLLVLMGFLLFAVSANSQFLTQSAEGKGSMPLPLAGAGVSVDIGKSEIAFGANNYERVFSSPKNRSFFGINLSGKNSTGLANLFSAGDIVPEGNLLAFFGRSWSNNEQLSTRYRKEVVDSKEIDSIWHIVDSLETKVYPDRLGKILDSTLGLIRDRDLQKKLSEDIQKSIRNEDPATWPDIIAKYTPCNSICSNEQCIDCQLFVKQLASQFSKLKEYYAELTDGLINTIGTVRQKLNQDFNKRNPVLRGTVFLMGNVQARSFKRFLGVTLPDLTKSFQDTMFRGGSFGLGLNFQYRSIWFGLTYNYVKRDNFNELTSKEYTLRNTDTSGQVLIQEKKITAYPGKYSRVEVNELNADILISIKLNPTDTSRLLLNPYVRATLFSRDTAFVKNVTDIGLGAYFLGKGRKLLVGLYVELPDVNNNREKAKPADEMNIRPPLKRLTFGVTTKINISSIFSFADRTRKPD